MSPNEGFKPVDYRPFMKEDEQTNNPSKSKVVDTNSKNPFSLEQMSIFWRILGDLEEVERRSNPGMEVDKTTTSEEKLHDELVSIGKFSQSDATMIIKSMEREEFGIEQVDGRGTIRRKAKL